MKKLIAGAIIAMVGCVSVPAWVDAQPRDGGSRSRGRGIAEQGRRDSYQGRRRRYRGNRWVYEAPEPSAPWAAVGGFLGGLWRSQAERPGREGTDVEGDTEPVGSMAYCIDRFKSYDANPRSPTYGTYLGYDGRRHACP